MEPQESFFFVFMIEISTILGYFDIVVIIVLKTNW